MMHTTNVNARQVPDETDIDTLWQRGDYFVGRDEDGVAREFVFCCPGCCGNASLCLDGSALAGRNWTLSGTDELPTLHPSIDHRGCWHGWLKSGKFESC